MYSLGTLLNVPSRCQAIADAESALLRGWPPSGGGLLGPVLTETSFLATPDLGLPKERLLCSILLFSCSLVLLFAYDERSAEAHGVHAHNNAANALIGRFLKVLATVHRSSSELQIFNERPPRPQ
jgi:hypothetical protein